MARSLHCKLVSVLVVVYLGPLAPNICRSQIEVIAAYNDISPDGNGHLATFTQPALSDNGDVAFLSLLSGTNELDADNIALFRGNSAGLSIVARKGVTPLDGVLISSFVNNWPSINSAGLVSHSADRAMAPGKWVAFLANDSTLTSFLSVDSSSPSGGNNQLSNHSVPVINAAGTAAYRARYLGIDPETGIYSRLADGMATTHLLAFAPAPRGGTILSLDDSLPTLNEVGQIAITASVDDGLFTHKSVMLLDGTTALELARDGDTLADGTTVIGNISSTAVPLNDLGQTAFVATYTQPTMPTRRGVFRAESDSVTLLTPGLLPGSAVAPDNLRLISMNNDGDVALATEFGAGSDPVGGIYLADDGGPLLIALEDTATPAAGKYFRRFLSESISLNENGQLAFVAELSNTINGALSGRALFRYDPTAGLEQIVRTGDALAGSTIVGFGFTGAAYSMTQSADVTQAPDEDFSGLNSLGQLAFNFALASGEGGVAVWSPESSQVAGDYNGNGIVDAADYTLWRDHLNELFTLTNEKPAAETPGLVDQEDYDFWRSRFGQTSGSGAGAATEPAAAPEPAAWILAALGAIACYHRLRCSSAGSG